MAEVSARAWDALAALLRFRWPRFRGGARLTWGPSVEGGLLELVEF